jgi:hypothetical protein
MEERNRLWRILIGQMVKNLEAIKAWEETNAPNKQEIIHDLQMEISGLLGFAAVAFGYKCEEIEALAQRTAPYNPANHEGLRKLRT